MQVKELSILAPHPCILSDTLHALVCDVTQVKSGMGGQCLTRSLGTK